MPPCWCFVPAPILQPLEPGFRGLGAPRGQGKETLGAFRRLGAAWGSVPGCPCWAALVRPVSSSSGLLLLTHLCVLGECASAQSL